MSNQVHFDSHLQIQKGINKIADAVKSTLGPRGQNVVIAYKDHNPIITKDGVTVARHINLEDPMEDIGAKLIQAVAQKTVEAVGDGTTTATVLAQAIFNQGFKMIQSGANPVEIKAGIDIGVKAVVEQLQKQSRPVVTIEETIQVATISTNGDEKLGELIANAIHTVGKDGVVLCKEGHKTDTEVKVVSGMQIDRGYASPYFVTDGNKMTCEMDNVLVLVSDKKIQKFKELLPILEQTVGKPLLIIADVEGEALATLVLNKMQKQLPFITIKPPVYWNLDQYQDVAIATGTEVISDVRGIKIENMNVNQLGRAEKITVSADTTIIAAGAGQQQAIDDRVARLKADLDQPNADKELLESRIAKLAGGIAMISVGGTTEMEVKERRDRVEDAIFATRAAVKEGIVPGGGLALFNAARSAGIPLLSDDALAGAGIVASACEEPLKVIAANCGKSPDIVAYKVGHPGEPNFGYNARDDKYENLLAAGIIDPTKVARLALENAASIVGLLLTTKAVVIESKKDAKVTNQ